MPSSSRLVQGCLPRLGLCTPGLGSLVRRAMSTRLSLKMSPVPSKTSGSRRGTRTGTKDSGALDSRSKTSGSLMSDEHIAKEGSNASDKFVVGVIGASLMIVQVEQNENVLEKVCSQAKRVMCPSNRRFMAGQAQEQRYNMVYQVMVATIGVVIWKLFGGMLSETSSVGGPRVGGPLRQKKTEGGNGHGLEWAVCEMQGWRAAMEDATCIAATLPERYSQFLMATEGPKFVNLRGKMTYPTGESLSRGMASPPRSPGAVSGCKPHEAEDEAAEVEPRTLQLSWTFVRSLVPKSNDKLAVSDMPMWKKVFNIYADRPDEEIKPDSWYPKWLWNLETPPKHYGDLTLMFVHGIDIEEATLSDYQRFLRLHRKMIIKINNLRLKRSKRRPGLKIA
ncbi:unnamed protein product [Symbiodinium microadriaticum]|nr:unnamed protein product [Symbiodinium microadriaticum]